MFFAEDEMIMAEEDALTAQAEFNVIAAIYFDDDECPNNNGENEAEVLADKQFANDAGLERTKGVNRHALGDYEYDAGYAYFEAGEWGFACTLFIMAGDSYQVAEAFYVAAEYLYRVSEHYSWLASEAACSDCPWACGIV